jgi:N-acetylglucosaminyl-diphospho-decaprenol L-rhamnosyltransferase
MSLAGITVSIVSHRQNALVSSFLGDLGRLFGKDISVVVTENVPGEVPLAVQGVDCPLELIVNQRPKGFGANHNAAFQRCRTALYCVANPDIRLAVDPFPALASALQGERVGVAAPLVRSPAGAIEDSARRSPTAASLLRKLFAGSAGPDYPVDRGPVEVDWVAGMFMLFRSEVFHAIGGFDEAYFLYYEDVDLCRRLRRRGDKVVYVPGAEVVHDARRGSHKDLSLMRHHVTSIARYLLG